MPTPGPHLYGSPTPGPVITPYPGYTGSPGPYSTPDPDVTQAPDLKNVCVYKGKTYTQGQRWQDGCEFDCVCLNSATGAYKCTEKCQRYPSLPPQCQMVQDYLNPCCQKPYCDFRPTATLFPPTYLPGHSPTPLSGGTPTPQAPTPSAVCIYNGVPFQQGDSWNDGCDLKCSCEDAKSGYYRCNHRCLKYDNIPATCILQTDPRDSCCKVPFCAPVVQSTPAPQPNTPSPLPGVSTPSPIPGVSPSLGPGMSPNPNPGLNPTPNPYPVPTAIPGILTGNGVNPNLNPTDNATMGCFYKGLLHKQGDKWVDGCEFNCECVDAKKSRYQCLERCPAYNNVPAYCMLVPDPNDACCKVPSCLPPLSLKPTTPAPLPGVSPNTGTPKPVVTLAPGQTYPPGVSPPVAGTPVPGTPVPVPRDVCTYKGVSYTQGQQFYDSCDKVCVCENGKTGFYRCSDRCTQFTNIPSTCTLIADPRDPGCCQVPQCIPSPGQPGYSTPKPGAQPTIATNVPGFVTGKAPVPSPTPGPDGKIPTPGPDGKYPTPGPGMTPAPRSGCDYKGTVYVEGQKWQDGCKYNCVCDDGKTGKYTCNERCPSYPMLPPQCTLATDPKDYCCSISVCDFNKPIATPGPLPNQYATPSPNPTPYPGGTYPPGFTPPTLAPGVSPQRPKTPYPGGTYPPGYTPAIQYPNGVSPPIPQTPYPGGTYPPGFTPPTLGPGVSPQRPKTPYPGGTYPPGYTPAIQYPNGVSPPIPQTPYPGGTYPPGFTPPTLGPGVSPQRPKTPYPGGTYPPGYTPAIQYPNGVSPPIPQTPYPGGTYPPGFTPPTLGPGVSPQRPKTPYPGGTYPPGYTPAIQYPNGVSPPIPQTPYPGGTYPPGFTPPTLGPGVSPQRPKTPYPGGTYPPGYTPAIQYPNGVSPPIPQTPYPGGTYPPGFTPPTLGPGVSPQRPKTPYPGGTYPPGYTPAIQYPNGVSPPIPQTPYPGGTYPPGFTPPTLGPGVSPQRPKTPYPGGTYPPGYTPAIQYPNGVSPPIPQTPYPGGTYPPGFTPPTLGPGVSPQRPKTPYPGGTYPPGYTPAIQYPNGVSPPIPQTPYPGGTYPPGYTPPTYAPGMSPPIPKTPYPGGTYPPGYTPGMPANPSPVPTIPPNPLAFCVYKGVPYRQGQSWQDGCSQKCRCEDPTNNYYTCFDRCPSYNLKAGCTLVTDTSDPCCQVPQCTYIPTPMPGVTPVPGSTPSPMPGVSPTAAPGITPYPNPSPLPTAIPGHISGQNPVDPKLNPVGKENFCLYKGQIFRQGQQWDDGCDFHCVCVDQSTGKYDCTEKCGKYVNIPPYCVMVQDPSNSCCKVPSCPGALNPVSKPTPQPTPSPGATYAPGVSPTLPAGVSPTPAGNPIPSPSVTPGYPIPKDVCVFQGKAYTQGQQWYEGCDRVCVCDDAHTGLYSCNVRCPTYNNLAPTCVMVPDPQDPICCKAPKCDNGNSTTGVIGTITGNGRPPTPGPVPSYLPGQSPSPGTGVTPSPGTQVTPPPQKVCVYKGVAYNEGQKWQDGCDFDCVCLDGTTGNYKCTDRCPRFPNLPLTCVLAYDPVNPCCKQALCGDQVPTPGPGVSTPKPPTIVNPTLYPGQVPTPQFCIYNGVPFRQGQKWNEGCDKVCRCEDAATKQVNCDDRCPSFPTIPPECSLATDPNDKCCHIVNCAANPGQPGTSITGVPGVITGHGLPTTSLNPYVTGKRDVCVYNGKTYKQGETWNDGCTYTCVCIDADSGKYQCTEKCPRYPPLPSSCTMVQDKTNVCCLKPYCPDLVPTPGPGVTPVPGVSTPKPGVSTPTPGPGVSPSAGSLHTPSIGGVPTPVDVCVYKGQQYKQGQMWYDGCDDKCRCEDAKNNFYRCQQRCAAFASVPVSCTLVPDPKDPMCCEVPSCPLPTPAPGVYPTPGFLTVTAGPTGVITGNGLIPTPKPGQPPLQPGVTPTPYPFVSPGVVVTPSPGSVATPLPKTGCYYKNHVYKKGESWDDACDFNCICLDDVTGKYKCSEKCQKFPSLPTQCVLIQDPSDKCCQKPYCDFMNPTPFPGGIPTPAGVFTPTPVPGINPNASPSTANMIGTGTSIFGKRGFCVYQGVYYNQGEEWNIGCSKTCRCEDVSTGYYSCHERCPSYDNVPSTCHLIASPTDPCCLVPECNNYPPVSYVTKPGLVGTGAPGVSPEVSYPNITGIYLPTNIPGTITGISGSNNNYNPQYGIGVSGIRTACVYKGQIYSQGRTWNDGCNYKCECIDAARGQYRCSERCPRYYNLPPQCKLNPDPADNCCEKAICDFTPTLQPGMSTTTQTPTSSTPKITAGVAIGKCVYTDGSIHNQGDMWSDGCDFDCKCDDATKNIYTCNQKCQAYSSLPSYCQLQPDPLNKCCERPVCTGGITALSGNNQPTASPTLDPKIQNIIPLGTHSVFTGTSQVSAIPGKQHIMGGRSVCVYHGTIYGQGESWDDGCKYVCTCKNAAAGVYQCTSKCPNFPPLPSYCKMQDIPGQCCPSLTCDVPGKDMYIPVPQLVPTPGPTPDSLGNTPTPQTGTQQLLVGPNGNTMFGGSNLPGAGATVPPGQTISGLRGVCVFKKQMYHQGETWKDGCSYDCECLDARSGYYSCKPMCPSYDNLPSDCYLVKPNTGCCSSPMCKKPDGTVINPVTNPNVYPVFGAYTGGFSGFRPGYNVGYSNTIGGSTAGCVYKGVVYQQGQKWDDGCDYRCECTDATTRQYRCNPMCTTYTSLPATCHLVPTQGCCKAVSCDTATASPSPSANPTCKDVKSNCAVYGDYACHGEYEAWGRANCAAFCGLCPKPTEASSCVDVLDNCAQYGPSSCSGAYEPWAMKNCAKTCNKCQTGQSQTTTTAVVVGACTDVLTNCASYGAASCKSPYEDWAKANCKRTCGYCPNEQIVTGQSHITTPKSVVGTGSLFGAGSSQGWIILMKGVAGVPGDLYQLWSGSGTSNQYNPKAMDLTNNFKGHYKPNIANQWDQCKFDQVKLSIYKNGIEKANIIFNAQGATKDNWMDPSRIISSTYSDIKNADHGVFSLKGDANSGREFYASSESNGCDAYGWMMVSTKGDCFYEKLAAKPAFYYSPTETRSHWGFTNPGEGDVMTITGHGGKCVGSQTGSSNIDECLYKGNSYKTGQSWQDGCTFNCSCVDGTKGFYRCSDLCPSFSNLPPNCKLEKQEGQCCSTPICHETKGVCVYKGRTYSEGQTWDDGCDYTCTCVDGSRSFYQCKTKCLQWNLPDKCHMGSPPAGKCCPVPNCPSGFVINYPVGYIEQ
ncbi:mucin-2-like [Haliotis asinina]|uniref:mucin-2-like n=1 Tax=Haliotis asinina TaxID=109174 RepID=UPI003531C5EB